MEETPTTNQQYHELEALIDAICTTAKLLEYTVDRGEIKSHIINGEKLISISLFYSAFNSLYITIIDGGRPVTSKILEKTPHEEKIQHLQKLLEEL